MQTMIKSYTKAELREIASKSGSKTSTGSIGQSKYLLSIFKVHQSMCLKMEEHGKTFGKQNFTGSSLLKIQNALAARKM